MPSNSRSWCVYALALTLGPTLTQSRVAMAAPGPWSADGSAEAAALRERVLAQRVAAGDAAGQRGVVYDKDTVIVPAVPETPGLGGPNAPGADVPGEVGIETTDLERRYELERIAKRGRSFFIPGVVLSTLGTLLVLGSIGGLASKANAVTGGLMGGSLVISAIGWPLLVVGVRMRKHPERYSRNKATARFSAAGIAVAF